MPKIEILSPAELKAGYAGPDGEGEYPAYTREEWREAVMHHHTIEGYWEWVHTALCEETAEADAEEDMDVSQVSYANKGTCTLIVEAAPAGDIPAELRDRLYNIVAEQLGLREGDILGGKSFVDDLGADSLDEVELVMAVEEEFEIEISDEEAERIKTVDDALALVAGKKRR